MPITTGGQLTDSKGLVQMAVKTNVKVFYFQDVADVTIFCGSDGRVDQQAFLAQWRGGLQEHKLMHGQTEVIRA